MGKVVRQAINHCFVCICMHIPYQMYIHLLKLVAAYCISKISPQTMRNIYTEESGDILPLAEDFFLLTSHNWCVFLSVEYV